MVNLESPLLTLGGLFLVGQNERGRMFTGGESGKGLLAGGFASSSAQFVVDEARNAANLDSSAVSDELAQALLGAGISRFGGPIPYNRAMARGIHYGVASQAFQDAGVTLGDFAGDFNLGGGNGNGGGNGSSATATAPRTTPRTNNTGSSAVVY